MKVPDQYRIRNHPYLGSKSSDGNNGFFVLPHHRIDNYFYNCQVSDGLDWEHVSVTITKHETIKRHGNASKVIKPVERCCTWEEMCFIKSVFWDDEESVMQIHPPKSQWINNHPYCLHLWKPLKENIPLPLSIMVGSKKLNIK